VDFRKSSRREFGQRTLQDFVAMDASSIVGGMGLEGRA
jgi:hypothetical protein